MAKRSTPIVVLLLGSLLIASGWSAAEAQSCPNCIFTGCHTPAYAVPPNFWTEGEMEPSDSVLVKNRDTSEVDGNVNPSLVARWIAISPVSDGTGSWLYAATGYHLQLWNLANPDAPSLTTHVPIGVLGIRAAANGHTPSVLTSVRAAPDDSNLVAIGGEIGAGLSIVRATNKTAPSLVYQDELRDVRRIYTTRINGRPYVFAAGDLEGVGARVYDMAAASGLNQTCYTNIPSSNPCPGVHVGSVGSADFDRATGIDGAGNFVAISTTTIGAPGGYLIYNVSNPASPVLVASGLAGQKLYAIAMWQEGGGYYIAVRTQNAGAIYNVSCIANGACTPAQSPIWSSAMAGSTIPSVTFSRSNGKPILYWARALFCGGSTSNRELLQDASNPANPQSLASQSYFDHYYWDTSTGFNFFSPREGRFSGDHFYRAGYSLLDVHVWRDDGPEVATIGSVSATPNPATTCQDVTFAGNQIANGFGGTYNWQVRTDPGGAVLVDTANGTDLNPFVWETESAPPGQYKGFLAIQNEVGTSITAASQPVTLTSPGTLPGAGTFAPTKVSDSSTVVTFNVAAPGASEWSWDFGDGNGFGPWITDPINGPRPSHVYSSSGSKTIRVRVRNCEGDPVTSSALVIDVPVVDPSTSVNISGPTVGATGISYTFNASGQGGCSPAANGWTWNHNGTGVSTSSSISVNWSTAGIKTITASNSASSCVGASDSHTFLVTAETDVEAAFTTQVSGLTVSFNAQSSQGSPTAYTWNFGDGQTGSGVATQHTYAAAGSYTVVLSVSKQDPSCTFGLCSDDKTMLIQVGEGICDSDADTFCALDGDFEIEVSWEKKNGETGVGKVVPSATSDNTGIFYFFDDGNWELLLKVLDGCAINQHFWVFGGAATNVKYKIRVTDLVTDEVWTYDNPQGKSSEAITDTSAFNTCTVDRNLMRENARAARAVERIDPALPAGARAPSPRVAADVGPCDPNANTLCAISERFRVKVSWRTKNGNTGNGAVVPATTDNTGVFWFFNQENWELLIKVLNGCGLNDHFWVFGAGATDVNYVVTVEDLATNATWEYENALGQASPAITDTTAFDTCNP